MATVTRDKWCNAVWRGQAAEVQGITCFRIGDRFIAWDTGALFEVLDPGIGWELIVHGLPYVPQSKAAILKTDAQVGTGGSD